MCDAVLLQPSRYSHTDAQVGYKTIRKSVASDTRDGSGDVARAWRRRPQRELSRKFARAVMRTLSDMQGELFGILKEIGDTRGLDTPGLQSVSKRGNYGEDVEAIISLLGVLSDREFQMLESLFNRYGSNMQDVFRRYLLETYQQGLDMAYDDMKRTARPQDPERFEGVSPIYATNPQSAFYRAFSVSGLSRVTDKVSVEMKGKAYRLIQEALRGGDNWGEMVTRIYRDVGTGKRGRYHWQRLVRTEMGFAYEQSQRERYQDAGVMYVKRNLARTACPVCRSVAGYWKADTAPALMQHPNCRCRYTPYYRLPRGAEINGI